MGRQHCTSPAMFNLEVFEVSCFFAHLSVSTLFSTKLRGETLWKNTVFHSVAYCHDCEKGSIDFKVKMSDWSAMNYLDNDVSCISDEHGVWRSFQRPSPQLGNVTFERVYLFKKGIESIIGTRVSCPEYIGFNII